MLFLGGFGVVFELLLLVYCVLNIVTSPEDDVRNLPRLAWLVLVVVLPLVGGISWLIGGRPLPATTARATRSFGRTAGLPRPNVRPARPNSTASPAPDDDEAFLRALRQRADEQRRRGAAERTHKPPDPPAPES